MKRSKKSMKLAAASVVAVSAIATALPASAAAASTLDSTISKAQDQALKAFETYYKAKGLASKSTVEKELKEATKLYESAKSKIKKSAGSKKNYYYAKLNKSKVYIDRTEGYLEGLHIAEQFKKDTSAFEKSIIKGDKNKIKSTFPTFTKKITTTEKNVKDKVYGKEVEKKFYAAYTTPAKITANAASVYYSFIKAEEQLAKNNASQAKKEMDTASKALSKVSKSTDLGKAVHQFAEKVLAQYKKALTTAPVLEYKGDKHLEVYVGEKFSYPTVTVKDNFDKKVVVKRVVSGPHGIGTVNTNIPGEYTITYTATDTHGNTSQKLVITVTVKNFELTVMHTNDTHAHIENMPRRITAIKQVRAEHPNSLLLDAGDVFSGTLYFTQYQGQADLEFMNLVGYDAMTFGNHEFDNGTEPLSKFVRNAKFPFVSANVNFSDDVNLKDRFNDKITSNPEEGEIYNGFVKEVNGQKVGIFGLTTAETMTIASPGDGVEFEDYIAQAKEAVANFKKQGVTKIVALTHIGYQDGGGDNDVTLAKEVEGIDVIVGGHSHDKLEAPVVDNTGEEPTLIVQANEYSNYLGVLDVVFDKKGEIIEHDGKLVELDKKENDQYVLQDDAEAAKILATKYKPAVDALKNDVVGKTEVALDGARENVRSKETNLGNLLTDSMLAKAKTINPNTTIAFLNGGGIRASIPAGDISVGNILEVLPFNNSLAIMQLTGAEIKAALEHAVSEAPATSAKLLQASGMKYTFDSRKPVGDRIVSAKVIENGTYSDLDLTKTYYVTTINYTAKGGDNFTMFAKAYSEGRVSEPGFVDWEIFRDYILVNPAIKPTVEGRITDIGL